MKKTSLRRRSPQGDLPPASGGEVEQQGVFLHRDTFELFEGWIFAFRAMIYSEDGPGPGSDWGKEHFKQRRPWADGDAEYWIELLREAWDLLGDAENREGALQLLHAAASEACQERDTKGFWDATKKERERQRRALQKARKKVERSLKAAAAALEHFLGVAREVTPYARKRFSFPAFSEAQEIVLRVEADNQGEISSWLQECENIAERIRAMEREYDPSPRGAGRKGPQDKAALNSALLKLTDLFFRRMQPSSRTKALEYTHCLLYVAGPWRDPQFHPLAAKMSPLQKQITS